jgi:hypothetical protein
LLYPGTNSCNNYGHKAIDCRAYAHNRNTWRRNSYENSRYQFEGNYVRNPRGAFDINYNKSGALNHEIESYNVTTLDRHLEIAKAGLQIFQVFQRKLGKYQNNKQFGKISKNICRLRSVGLLYIPITQEFIGVLTMDA